MTKYTGPIKEVEVVEKVKLTEFQAKEFESFKTLRSSLEEWARDKQDPNATYSIIHELTFDEMARAYLIGYEIEPEEPKFQPGDSIIRKDGERFKSQLLVDSVKYFDEIPDYLILSSGWQVPVSEVRHATPEEIYWLEELGRDKVGDFRDGDIYVKENYDCYLVGSDVFAERALDWYEEDYNFRGLYPADSFRPFKKEPSNE